MNNLIELAKKNAGFTSDYQLAKAIDASMQLMSNWQREKSKPNGIYTAKIMKAGRIEPEQAIACMEEGFANVSLIAFMALGSLSTLALTTFAATPSQWLTAVTSYCILCKMAIIRVLQKTHRILRRLRFTAI